MEQKIILTNHIDELFIQAPKNQAVFELKEEVLANAQERFDDLLESGKNPDEALKIVQAGISRRFSNDGPREECKETVAAYIRELL